MKTTKMNLMILTTVILLTAPVLAGSARAKVRIDATLRTPGVTVRVGNGHHASRVTQVRVHREYRVNERDRTIARRLSRYIGVSKRELLRMRRAGYRWIEIGREFGVSRAVVRAASNGQSWKRYLRHDRRSGQVCYRNPGERPDRGGRDRHRHGNH